jgi:D-cysteine desulfhydrase
VPSPEQARFIVRVARSCGLILDPVYSGKALYGLSALRDKPARVLFIHTGGLPGLLAQSAELTAFV